MSRTRGKTKPSGAAQIEEFISLDRRNDIIGYDDARAYLRKSMRWVNGSAEPRSCLELSSIVRKSRARNLKHDPQATSTGFMRRFMDDLETQADRHGLDVRVESVANEWLPE